VSRRPMGPHKSITIRIPDPLWRKLHIAIANGEIKSITRAALDGMTNYPDAMAVVREVAEYAECFCGGMPEAKRPCAYCLAVALMSRVGV